MGYEGFSNQELLDVVEEWKADPPPPDSPGARASQAALAELRRRQLGARSSTAARAVST